MTSRRIVWLNNTIVINELANNTGNFKVASHQNNFYAIGNVIVNNFSTAKKWKIDLISNVTTVILNTTLNTSTTVAAITAVNNTLHITTYEK